MKNNLNEKTRPDCILYYSNDNGIDNKEIDDSDICILNMKEIPSSDINEFLSKYIISLSIDDSKNTTSLFIEESLKYVDVPKHFKLKDISHSEYVFFNNIITIGRLYSDKPSDIPNMLVYPDVYSTWEKVKNISDSDEYTIITISDIFNNCRDVVISEIEYDIEEMSLNETYILDQNIYTIGKNVVCYDDIPKDLFEYVLSIKSLFINTKYHVIEYDGYEAFCITIVADEDIEIVLKDITIERLMIIFTIVNIITDISDNDKVYLTPENCGFIIALGTVIKDKKDKLVNENIVNRFNNQSKNTRVYGFIK